MRKRRGLICGKKIRGQNPSLLGEPKKKKLNLRNHKKGKVEEEKKDEEGKKEKELLKAKIDEKTLTNVWELLMNSKAHREALVLPLGHKKILISHTPEQMVCSLAETPP